jgi:enoyl-[acyl-carrier-protein] reductase (NADH)
VRLLSVEVGEPGVKVNGISPSGVVRGSGILAAGWGTNRAKAYGVDEEDLGKFYAQRTIHKREVLPENVANAVSALTGPDLSHTTGMHISVDAGAAAAFFPMKALELPQLRQRLLTANSERASDHGGVCAMADRVAAVRRKPRL